MKDLRPRDVVTILCMFQDDHSHQLKPRPAVIMQNLENEQLLIVPLSSKSGLNVGPAIEPTNKNGLYEQSIAMVLEKQARSNSDFKFLMGRLSPSDFKRVWEQCAF